MRNQETIRLKEKVGIIDIALSLGYLIDRHAGVGKFVEMVHLDGRGNQMDDIVIKHPNDKGQQKFFHRISRQSGDVFDFIIENINSFSVDGKSDFEKAKKVMRQFANEPVEESEDRKYLAKAIAENSKPFDASRYETASVAGHEEFLKRILGERSINSETIKAFAPYMRRIRDTKADNHYYNLGFPYIKPGTDKVVGYEICGMNHYKNKAAGTDSSTAAWIVDMSKGRAPEDVRNVYFAESAFDMMAFWQINHVKVQPELPILVSIGGTFSDQQVNSIMRYYPNARAVDCFDNDVAGRVAGIRMAGLMEGFHPNIVTTNEDIRVQWHDKEVILPRETASICTLKDKVDLNSERIGQWKPAKAFKDWNDQVMNKPMEPLKLANKYQRNEHLAAERGMGVGL